VVPSPPTAEQPPFYVDIGAWQGRLYDRNAFTAGTGAEVDALVARTGLESGQRVLDVGCGTGRHLRELRRRGIDAVGVDVSPDLVEVATERLRADEEADRSRADFEVVVGDARHLAATLRRADLAGRFDVAWSLCHGGFGTDPDGEVDVLAGLAAAVRPGGHVVVTAFHALFAVRHLVDGDAFDPQRLVHHQRSDVRGPDGQDRGFDLWTVTHTVPGLVALADSVGLEVVSIDGAEPGAYDRQGVGLDDPELLVVLGLPEPAG
jgi:SAM-dependent methyltransferase